MIVDHLNFRDAIRYWTDLLLSDGIEVDAGHWQGVATKGRPDLVTRELTNVSFTCPVLDLTAPILPKSPEAMVAQLRDTIKPNLPWADEHFAERVSRVPSNPGEAYKSWPWWRGQNDKTMEEGKFSHTYQERFWPKEASEGHREWGTNPLHGVRYDYGDLDDLVDQLARWPLGRQAYLPIFFPEDTGNVHGGRLPCTLGYHFLVRERQINMWYFIRSCDAVRHFRDDLYLAARLLVWVLDELQTNHHDVTANISWRDIRPGYFTFVCPSLHYHRGDEHHIKN